MPGHRSPLPLRPSNSTLLTLTVTPLPEVSESVVEESSNTYVDTSTNKERKTEKSVRFASDNESLSYDESDADLSHSLTENGNIVSCIPSEFLYDDTFTSESLKESSSDACGSKIQTDPSYGTNTFVDVASEEETRTLSEYSYTDSFVSSGVFSNNSESEETTFREWGHGTEIVRDIEDLKESEFVNRLQLKVNQEAETDVAESEVEEGVEILQQNFLQSTIRKLKLKDLQSPKSLDQDFQLHRYHGNPPGVRGSGGQEETTFCKRMIVSCQRTQASVPEVLCQDQQLKHHHLEYYGLSSDIVNKLKNSNFQQWFKKKMASIDNDVEESLEYIRNNQRLKDTLQEQQFINQMKAFVLKENMDDCIQAHLIKMHPIKWFSDFISELPKFDEDTREVLYKYKKLVENRMLDEVV
uniref:Uncharacterized protein n=1 Tax=Arion vulgaris TaxID=1028688 RepID=A0A0B6ZZA2_9EUPU